MSQLKPRKTSDDYSTDLWLKQGLFYGWHDPCPLGGLDDPSVADGLTDRWALHNDRVFVNPPYSNPLPWVEKAINESRDYAITVVLLLNHDSSTKWWAKLHEAGAHFLPIIGRLKWGRDVWGPQASVLCVLSGSDAFGWGWDE
jgi:hypothetical protein